MLKLFISHSSHDDAFVRQLRTSLANHGPDVWIDSRELRGGDLLWPEIQQAIESASAFIIVISPESLQSKWVGKELRHALNEKAKRKPASFPIIPLALNDTRLGVLEEFFESEPHYITVPRDAAGIAAAIHPILVALGQRLPSDPTPPAQRKTEPLEELILELADLKFHEASGERLASARARLVYEPATPGQPNVHSEHSWRLVAPIGPIATNDLRWYLEKYANWPSHYFRERARTTEQNLVKWGRLLHEAAIPAEHTANVMNAWARIDPHAGRRFSVYVDTTPEAGAFESDTKITREAATELLKLPWELLHDGGGYLFQGAKPTRVRRRLPSTKALDVPVVATPIRILLVTARPEDDACSYIDHRASALPMVEAIESLPGLVEIHVLSPPTFPALRTELDRRREEKQPYHVIHFDGHGVYNRRTGLGGLCFEHPEDIDKLEKRRHITVYTKGGPQPASDLGSLLRDHRIPLVVLDACQTAQAENASESVASELLKAGVASVVAMSHSVLLETARRFVKTFYRTLAQGKRVGDAMLAGQRELKDNTFRGNTLGEGDLRLEDWFVPVLFQEKEDPQLFTAIPNQQTLADFQTALARRSGELPAIPQTGFIGRSRELLALQRLLRHERYAVIRGQGGEGKTTLAAEFARWMVRSHQVYRAAFVSVERDSNCRAVIDTLGRQLVGRSFSAVGDLEEAIQHVERVMREEVTLLVVDNMETLLAPAWVEVPEALSEYANRELQAILNLCVRLNGNPNTRIVFTSREPLPEPYDGEHHQRDLRQLEREDAVKLVERVLNTSTTPAGTSPDAAREEIEQLVETVHCHARTLTLLASALKTRGVAATRQSLVALMQEMDQRFPGNREKSLFASVELSLRRLSEANRERVKVLAVFHGVVDLDVLRQMMEWEAADVSSLAEELIETGLATLNVSNHLTLNPALCPYLRGQMDPPTRADLTDRWVTQMTDYLAFLRNEIGNPETATQLTVLELPNFFALLDLTQAAGNPKMTIAVTTLLYPLLSILGKPQLLERLRSARDKAISMLGNPWSAAQLDATRTRIEQLLADGRLVEARESAAQLLERVRTEPRSYSDADYDLAAAHLLLARVLKHTGEAERALPHLHEARLLFESIDKEHPGRAAGRMLSVCAGEQSECLCELGRLDEALTSNEAAIQYALRERDLRALGIAKYRLGSIRTLQGRYTDALDVYSEVRDIFTTLSEPQSIAAVWHQIGDAYEKLNQPEPAEDAYRNSLSIQVRLGNVPGQAATLNQLGTLYDTHLERRTEAVALYRQAADKYVSIQDLANEGLVRYNLADILHKLGHRDEARLEISRAIECKAQFGHTSQIWATWNLLARIELDSADPAAATAARAKAITSYLAYRRDGGENHESAGWILDTLNQIRTTAPDEIRAFVQQLAENVRRSDDTDAGALAFIQNLESIVAGSPDLAFVDNPALNYVIAAELLLLIETLGLNPIFRASNDVV